MHCAPRLYRPRAPLSDYVDFFGHLDGAPEASYRSRALPRGAVTVVFDVGPRQRVDFYAADGRTRLTVPPAFITGAHTSSYVSDIAPGQPAMAIHFRPGGALPFLGMPLGELEDAVVGVEDVWGRDGNLLHQRLIETTSAAARFALLEEFLLSHGRWPANRNPALAAAMHAVEQNPSIPMSDVRAVAGMATKRLIAAFREEIGLSPKAYARVRRFQAALRHLSAGEMHGADIAAAVGYFDQAHFVREFRSFAGMTPRQYLRHRILLPSHVPVERQKYPIPRRARCA